MSAINTALENAGQMAPLWLQDLLADCTAVTRGPFKVQAIGLRPEQIERAENWARKHLRHVVGTQVTRDLLARNEKATRNAVCAERNARLAALRWTEFNGTAVKPAGQH